MLDNWRYKWCFNRQKYGVLNCQNLFMKLTPVLVHVYFDAICTKIETFESPKIRLQPKSDKISHGTNQVPTC